MTATLLLVMVLRFTEPRSARELAFNHSTGYETVRNFWKKFSFDTISAKTS